MSRKVLIKKLEQKGYSDIRLFYYTRSNEDWGWWVEAEKPLFTAWLGFTLKEAIKRVEKICSN